MEFESPTDGEEAEQDANDDDDDAPICFHRMEMDALGPSSPPSVAHQELGEYLLLARDVKLSTLTEAQKHECSCHAMLDKMTSIEAIANATWSLSTPPPPPHV